MFALAVGGTEIKLNTISFQREKRGNTSTSEYGALVKNDFLENSLVSVVGLIFGDQTIVFTLKDVPIF
jgi:hypothetical protein